MVRVPYSGIQVLSNFRGAKTKKKRSGRQMDCKVTISRTLLRTQSTSLRTLYYTGRQEFSRNTFHSHTRCVQNAISALFRDRPHNMHNTAKAASRDACVFIFNYTDWRADFALCIAPKQRGPERRAEKRYFGVCQKLRSTRCSCTRSNKSNSIQSIFVCRKERNCLCRSWQFGKARLSCKIIPQYPIGV